jgi:hypothetical protein
MFLNEVRPVAVSSGCYIRDSLSCKSGLSHVSRKPLRRIPSAPLSAPFRLLSFSYPYSPLRATTNEWVFTCGLNSDNCLRAACNWHTVGPGYSDFAGKDGTRCFVAEKGERIWVWGLELRASSLGLGAWGLGLEAWDLGSGAWVDRLGRWDALCTRYDPLGAFPSCSLRHLHLS